MAEIARVDSAQLKQWLVRRLILKTGRGVVPLGFPAGEGVSAADGSSRSPTNASAGRPSSRTDGPEPPRCFATLERATARTRSATTPKPRNVGEASISESAGGRRAAVANRTCQRNGEAVIETGGAPMVPQPAAGLGTQ